MAGLAFDVNIPSKSLSATTPTTVGFLTAPTNQRVKLLGYGFYFDGNSLWVCARRMEEGRLHWPASEDGRVQLTREEFALLIGGIDLSATTKRKWYRKAPVGEGYIAQETA